MQFGGYLAAKSPQFTKPLTSKGTNMSSSQTYLMHRQSIEGGVFYHNLLASPEYVRTYFPPTAKQVNYSDAPKIAIPFTSTFINRITSLLHSNLSVAFSDQRVQNEWNIIEKNLNWLETVHWLATNMLVGGNAGAIIRPNYSLQSPQIETWKAEYLVDDGWAQGYQYIISGGEMHPILSEPKLKKEESLITTVFDDNLVFITGYGEPYIYEHNLGFNPVTIFKSIDMDEDGVWGRPYHYRFRDLNIEYNHIVSQVSKSIKILQNVWKTNGETPNLDNPLRFDPDTINYTGKDGILEQVVRELNVDPEFTYLQSLSKLIHNASQIPDFMSGLAGVGKIESGVALQIASTPLIELMSRIRTSFKESLEELVTKVIKYHFATFKTVNQPSDFTVDIQLNDTFLPVDKEKEVETIIKLVQNNILTPEEGKKLLTPLLGLINLS